MKKIKYVLAADNNSARDYAIENKLESKEWIYLLDQHQLQGIDSKTIEFIFLDGWWMNNLYGNKGIDDIILYHTILGAKKTYL